MLQQTRSISQVIANSGTALVQLPAPARGRLHRLNIARVNTDSSANLTSVVTARLCEDDVSAYTNPADGRRCVAQVIGTLVTTSSHIQFNSDIGAPFTAQQSTQAVKDRNLYLELVAGLTGGGTYEISYLTSSDKMG